MPEHIIDDNFDVKIHGYVFCGQSVHTHLPKAAENYGITQEEWTVMSERLNKGLKANNCYRALHHLHAERNVVHEDSLEVAQAEL
mmetsp:Transcript_2164/g.3043  ORF Transcript_2164/g.3043 Transcript_2164/m.3043 type:complete len:85 (+) Transcript_2164:97-351(+)